MCLTGAVQRVTDNHINLCLKHVLLFSCKHVYMVAATMLLVYLLCKWMRCSA